MDLLHRIVVPQLSVYWGHNYPTKTSRWAVQMEQSMLSMSFVEGEEVA